MPRHEAQKLVGILQNSVTPTLNDAKKLIKLGSAEDAYVALQFVSKFFMALFERILVRLLNRFWL
jgi:hypothetical protein